jgi:CheY-like chemotaxis protein
MHKKVIVIDDNEIDRYIAETVIVKNSFSEKVISVESAKEALKYLVSFENTPEELPDLIFLDINMPEMTGFDFLDEYEKLSENIKKNCIIMMLTTSINQEDRTQAEACKYVYGFMNKPLDHEKIRNIDICLQNKGPVA